jgi:hypothetical protein
MGQLKAVGIDAAKLVQILGQGGGSCNLKALLALMPDGIDPSSEDFKKTRMGQLKTLGIDAAKLVKIIGQGGGSCNLKALLALMPAGIDSSSEDFKTTRMGQLKAVGIGGSELVKIVGKHGGSHNLEAFLHNLDLYKALSDEEKASFFRLVSKQAASVRIYLAAELMAKNPDLDKSALCLYLIRMNNAAAKKMESLSAAELSAMFPSCSDKKAASAKSIVPKRQSAKKLPLGEKQQKPSKSAKNDSFSLLNSSFPVSLAGPSEDKKGGGSSGGGVKPSVLAFVDYRRLIVPGDGDCAFYSFIFEFLRSSGTEKIFVDRMVLLFGEAGKLDLSLNACLRFVQSRFNQKMVFTGALKLALTNLIANLRLRVLDYYEAHAGDLALKSAGWDSPSVIDKLKAECRVSQSWVSREIFAVLGQMMNAHVTLMTQAILSEVPGVDLVYRAADSYHPGGAVEVNIIFCKAGLDLKKPVQIERDLNHYDALPLASTAEHSYRAIRGMRLDGLRMARDLLNAAMFDDAGVFDGGEDDEAMFAPHSGLALAFGAEFFSPRLAPGSAPDSAPGFGLGLFSLSLDVSDPSLGAEILSSR